MASYKAGQVDIEIKTVQAWIELAKGNSERAVALMNAATDMESKTTKHPVTPGEVLPANQLLGDMYTELNDPENAMRAYESDLVNHPNRFNSIHGAAIAAKNLGDNEKATAYFEALVQLVGKTTSDRIELKEAKEYLNI